MEGSSSTNMEDLGSKALDSIDVRKKQVGFSQSIHNKSTSATVIRDTRNKYLVHDLRSPQTPMSEGSMNAPRTFSDLCPEVRDTPPDAVAHQLTPKPNFMQSNVYPIRSKPRSELHQIPNTDTSIPHPFPDKSNPSKLSQPLHDAQIHTQGGTLLLHSLSPTANNQSLRKLVR